MTGKEKISCRLVSLFEYYIVKFSDLFIFVFYIWRDRGLEEGWVVCLKFYSGRVGIRKCF